MIEMTEIEKTEEFTSDKTLLTEKEVYDVLEFQRGITSGVYGNYNNYFSPDMINQAMKDINLNPLDADEDKIESALKSPKTSEEELIGYNQHFELTDMIYKRAMSYMGNMLSYDWTYSPINVDVDRIDNNQYNADVRELNNFMERFNHKKEFSRATRQMLRQEAYYTVLRDEGERYTLQELPRKYCKLTGRWDYGWLFDFDMGWFMQPSVDIRMYPNSMKEMYNRFYLDNDKYTPSRPVGKRSTGFTCWEQTDPEDGYWAWKFNPDMTTLVPHFAPLLSDTVLRPLIRTLQKNIYVLQAQKVMVGLIPLLKDNKSGNVKDALAIEPETMGKFLGLLRKGLDDSIKVGGAPFEDIKTLDFDSTDKDILDSYSSTMASSATSGGRILYSSDKQTAKETEISVAVDEYIMTYLYPYFEEFLEFQINKRTKKYKFKINLEGTNFKHNRDERLDNALKLADKGIVLPQKIAASIGMSLKEMEMHMTMAKISGFDKKLINLVNIYNQNGATSPTDNPSNRPREDVNDLTDSGLASREDGG